MDCLKRVEPLIINLRRAHTTTLNPVALFRLEPELAVRFWPMFYKFEHSTKMRLPWLNILFALIFISLLKTN